MADLSNYPQKYLQLLSQQSKQLSLVLEIEGLNELFGIGPTFTQIRYGDFGITYGLPGVVYGGLRRVGSSPGERTIKPYMMLDSSLAINQRIEPEQGKGNIGLITITLIDKNGEIARIVSPGIVLDEILFSKETKLWLGFTQTSFPEDYVLLYRGYVTQVTCPPGTVQLQLSDGTSKKRQPVCDTPTTRLTDEISAVDTTIPVVSTADFHRHILGPDGTYDPIVRTYINVDSEWMEYGASGVVDDFNFLAARGGSSSLGTTPTTHEAGASVANGIQIGGNVSGENFVNIILKLLLSGWGGPCETDVSILSFVFTYDLTLGMIDNAFVLESADAKAGLGLTIGDYFTVSGASNPGNNVTGVITDIQKLNDFYLLIYTDQTFTLENPTTATVDFRSKYDTLPVTCGAKCRMRDVDVAGMEELRDTYFSVLAFSAMRLFYNEPRFAKDIIDTDILLPMGCYSISRFGRISFSMTKAPLPTAAKLVELNINNVIDPDRIVVTRSANARSFYNVIKYEFDKGAASGEFGTVKYFFDTDSINRFNQKSELPIPAPGLVSALSGNLISNQRGSALLNRYKNCTVIIEVTVNWSVGSVIEVSDIVLMRDNDTLKIMNFDTGKRNMGYQLFEVIDRTYQIYQGNVKLKLMGGVGFDIYSRFALISPSSLMTSSSTSSVLRLKPSFGTIKIEREMLKWQKYFGLPIQVHNFDWSISGTTTLIGFNATDPTALDVSPPLGFTPGEDFVVDINDYPTTTDSEEELLYKKLFTHFTPSFEIVTGISPTQFTLSAPDAARIVVGNAVKVRSPSYSVISADINVEDVTGVTVTLASALAFTPSPGDVVYGIGFEDHTGFYRWG